MRSEDFRRKANLVICYVAWLGALATTLWVIGDINRRPYGTIVVLLIGVGITATLIRSRYRLTDTIAEVFRIGIHTGKEDADRKSYMETTEEGPDHD